MRTKYFFDGHIIGVMTLKINEKSKTCKATISFNIKKRYELHYCVTINKIIEQASEYCTELASEYKIDFDKKYKFQKQPIVMSSSAIEACRADVYDLDGLSQLIEIVQNAQQTASTQTHYNKLDEWSKPLYEFIHAKLNDNVNYEFWKSIFCVMNSVIYSPNLITKVANHHSSAFDRNTAILTELQFIYNYKKSNR